MTDGPVSAADRAARPAPRIAGPRGVRVGRKTGRSAESAAVAKEANGVAPSSSPSARPAITRLRSCPRRPATARLRRRAEAFPGAAAGLA